MLQPSSRSYGFTLVESLVALTIMMILLLAIGRLGAASLRAGRHIEHHLADIENAQRILAELPSRRNSTDYPLSGETAGYRWRVEAEQLDTSAADSTERTGWIPETVLLTLQGASGVPLRFDMVRLIRAAAK